MVRMSILVLLVLMGLSAILPSLQAAAAPSPEQLESYVGQYQLAPDRLIAITRDGVRLFAQNSGAPKVEIFPESDTEFSYRSIKARIKFVVAADKSVSQLTVGASGVERVAKRLDAMEASRIASLPQNNIEVPIDPARLKLYLGYYQVRDPDLVFVITQEGAHLFAQIVGQPKAQIFPKSDREFFYKIVPGQISFAAADAGPSKRFVLHQGGKDYEAVRISDGEGQRKAEQVRAQAAATSAKKAVAVDQGKLESYIGSYKISPTMSITISLDGSRLYSQTTVNDQAMPKQEIFAESDTRFFFKNAPLLLTFVQEPGQRTGKLLVTGGGQDAVAVRTP